MVNYTVWHVMREVTMHGTGDGKVLLEVVSSHYTPEEAVRAAEMLGQDLTPKLEGKTVTSSIKAGLGTRQLQRIEYVDEHAGQGDVQKILVLEILNASKHHPRSAAALKYHVMQDKTIRRMTVKAFNIPELISSHAQIKEAATVAGEHHNWQYTRMLDDEPLPYPGENEDQDERLDDKTMEAIEYVSGPIDEEEEFDENEDVVRVYIHNVDNPRWTAKQGYLGPRSNKPVFTGEGRTLGASPKERPALSPPIQAPLKRAASATLAPPPKAGPSKQPGQPDSNKRLKTDGKVIDLTEDSP